MTDRELLQMAAKAAGIKALRDPHGFLRNCTGFDPAQNIFSAPMWNPLTDDGDALRLAVKLRLPLRFDDWSDGETVLIHKGNVIEAENILEQDPYAATRRAIVRAAAEIGKAMP